MTRDRWLLAVAIKTWLTIGLLSILMGTPLGHDEAQYAVAARAGSSPWLYLSPGTIAIARFGVLLGGQEWMLRLLPLVLGCGFVVGAWLVGRVACGARVGVWSAAIIAGAHPLALRNAELLGDLPAAACLLAGIAVLVHELERKVSLRLVMAAPLFATAFYLRYGSAPMIAIAAIAAAILWWRRIVARPMPVMITLFVFAALLVPHAIDSLRTTGSLLGILRFSASVPYRRYVGEGLVTYLTANPFMFYGALVAPAMAGGLASVFRPPARWRPMLFLYLIAVAQIIALGLQTRAQPRYVCVAIVLLVVLGVDLVARCGPLIVQRSALLLVTLAWLGAELTVIPFNLHLARERAPIETASAAIRNDDAGRPCVIAAHQLPQMMWKTRCDAVIPAPPVWWPADRRRYIVSASANEVDVNSIARQAEAIAVTLPEGARPQVWYLPATSP